MNNIVAAYKEAGDVVSAALKLGLPPQVVAVRLQLAGYTKLAYLSSGKARELAYDHVAYARIGKLSRMAFDYGWTLPFLKARISELGSVSQQIAWGKLSDQAVRALFDHYGSVSLTPRQYEAKYGVSALNLRESVVARWPDEWLDVASTKIRKKRGTVLGRDTENRLRDKLTTLGWVVVRSAGSFGAADLIALKSGTILLIQVKRSGSLGTEGWNKLWEAALVAGATPLMAENPYPSCWRLWRLTSPKTGRGRQPMIQVEFSELSP